MTMAITNGRTDEHSFTREEDQIDMYQLSEVSQDINKDRYQVFQDIHNKDRYQIFQDIDKDRHQLFQDINKDRFQVFRDIIKDRFQRLELSGRV